MRMMVTAETATVYGKTMKRGEEFECPDKEALLWHTLARAAPVAGDGEAAGEQLDLVGEQGQARQRRGRYNRRDMRAEG